MTYEICAVHDGNEEYLINTEAEHSHNSQITPTQTSFILYHPKMPSDFERMLNTFKAATGCDNTSNNNDKLERKSIAGSGDRTSSSLKEDVERLWNVSLLRKTWKAAQRKEAAKVLAEEATTTNKEVHLAVCACIVDDLPHERIWRRWMDESSSSAAEMYIHAKYPDRVQSSWARRKLISQSFQPNWNDVRIIQAMLALAKEALLESKTSHVLFCTESCIPLSSSWKDSAQRMLKNDTSYLNAYNSSDSRFTRFDERSCWSKLAVHIPYIAIWKAVPGWCVLCRKHIQQILDMPRNHLSGNELWPAFQHVWAPEEVFFSTALSLLGILPSDEVSLQSLVFSQFIPGQAHPMEYDFEKGDWNKIMNHSEYITLRKVKRPVNVTTWERLLLTGTSTNRSEAGDTEDSSHPNRTDAEQASLNGSLRKRYRNHDEDDDDDDKNNLLLVKQRHLEEADK